MNVFRLTIHHCQLVLYALLTVQPGLSQFPIPDSILVQFSLEERIELMSLDTTRTWEDLDSLYKAEIASRGDRHHKNNCYISMVEMKSLIDLADTTTLNYYARELEAIDFNINLHTIVLLIERLKHTWKSTEVARFASSIYDKNIRYWNTHFIGQVSYLDMNDQALFDLKQLAVSKQ